MKCPWANVALGTTLWLVGPETEISTAMSPIKFYTDNYVPKRRHHKHCCDPLILRSHLKRFTPGKAPSLTAGHTLSTLLLFLYPSLFNRTFKSALLVVLLQ